MRISDVRLLREWLADHDWPWYWRVLMDDVGLTREGQHPYTLTPWIQRTIEYRAPSSRRDPDL